MQARPRVRRNLPVGCHDNAEALRENLAEQPTHSTPPQHPTITAAMAALPLRPLARLSSRAILDIGAHHGYSGFSTIALHQLQHPAPASTARRFLPRFLDPSIYWSGPKSVSRTKNSQGPQGPKPWNPATFYIVCQPLHLSCTNCSYLKGS